MCDTNTPKDESPTVQVPDESEIAPEATEQAQVDLDDLEQEESDYLHFKLISEVNIDNGLKSPAAFVRMGWTLATIAGSYGSMVARRRFNGVALRFYLAQREQDATERILAEVESIPGKTEAERQAWLARQLAKDEAVAKFRTGILINDQQEACLNARETDLLMRLDVVKRTLNNLSVLFPGDEHDVFGPWLGRGEGPPNAGGSDQQPSLE